MIAMVEGAARQKTPNEIALNILLVALTIIFSAGYGHSVVLCALAAEQNRADNPADVISLVALFCLPGPHHHWCVAFVHWHCGHEPA